MQFLSIQPKAALIGLAFLCTDCKSCERDKPYVPFSMSDSAAPSAEPAQPTSSTPVPASAFPAVLAVAPTGDARSFSIEGKTWTLRAGRVFRWATPLTAEGKLLAWTEKPTSSQGELTVVSADNTESVVYKLPANLDIDHCSHQTAVARIGEKVLALSVDLTCGEEAKSVLAVAREEEGGQLLLRYEAMARESLRLSATTVDRDADGAADLVVGVSQRSARGPVPINAELTYLDRPTGYAGDPAEPDASLGKLGKALLSYAVAKKPDTLASAESALEFASSLCGDAGHSRFQSNAGAPTCKESRVFGDAVHAFAILHDHQADTLRSVVASELAGSLKFEFGRVTQIDQIFAKKVTKVSATPRTLDTKAPSKWPTAELRFDAENKLSIRTESGFVTLDPATNEPLPAAFEDAASPPTFGSGDSTVTVLGVKRTCNPSHTVLLTNARGADHETPVPLLESAIPWNLRKEACASTILSPALIALSDGKATLAIDGEAFEATYGDSGVSLAPAKLAGELHVVPLLRSIFVSRGPAKERWVGKEMEGAHSCKASANGSYVACFRADKVVLYTKDTKAAPAPKPAPKGSAKPR